jgi:hypothetical protein
MNEAVVNYSEIESGLIESYEVAVIFSEKESDSECNTNESTSDSEKENADWDDDKASDEDQDSDVMDSDNGEGPGNKALSNILMTVQSTKTTGTLTEMKTLNS